MKIGEVRCLFLTCYKQGRTPFLSIGPSWPFTLFLFVFALFIVGFFSFMLHMMKTKTWWTLAIMITSMTINFGALLMGIFMNPGIS